MLDGGQVFGQCYLSGRGQGKIPTELLRDWRFDYVDSIGSFPATSADPPTEISSGTGYKVTSSELPQVMQEPWSTLSLVDRRAIRALYEQAFPPSERRDWGRVIAAGCRLWTARRGCVVVGFATTVELGDTKIALLQYLAVAQAVRSSGIGSALLVALSRQFAAERHMRGILLEIEDPFEVNAPVQTKRRLAFYERWGAERVTCINDYFMVDFSDPLRRIPMLLLWKPLLAHKQPNGAALRSALAAIFASEYAETTDRRYLDHLIANVIC